MMGKPTGYQVFWNPVAEQQPASIWMAALNREEVAAAVIACEQALSRDPNAAGESREESYRLSIVRPLAFVFRVSELDRTVWVMRVRHVRRSH